MPLTLNVGLTKKQGLPDYGSVGASCNVTFELDSGLIQQDLEAFHRHVRNAYVACAQSVNDELARQRDGNSTGDASAVSSRANGDEHRAGSNGTQQKTNGQRASQKQRDYIDQLARQIRGLGVRRLDGLAQKMFGKPITELTSLDASGVIDMLKDIKDGRVSLEDALNGVAA